MPLCILYLNCYYISSLFVFHFLYHSVGAPTKLTNALEVVGLDLELLSINCDVSSWLQVTGDRIILNRPGKKPSLNYCLRFACLQNRIVNSAGFFTMVTETVNGF